MGRLVYNPFPTDELNTVHFRPDPNAGANGKGILLRPNQMPLAKRLFPMHQFNLLASDLMPLNRSLPDARSESCRSQKHDFRRLASTSLIIALHNEAWSTLLRTVHSCVQRAENERMLEVILVDDASEREYLGAKLENYVKAEVETPSMRVKVLRLEKRSGLVAARMAGARLAKGEVLVFLDSHW